MKRTLAIILALLMLFSVAMAEENSAQFSVRVTSSMQLDQEYITSSLGELIDPNLLKSIVDVLNSMREETIIQTDGVQATLYLKDKAMINESVLLSDQEIALLTSILPEKKLTIDLRDERVQEMMKQLQKMMAKLNIGQAANGLVEAVMNWAESLKTEHVDGTVQRELLGACSNYDMMTITGNDAANLAQKILDQTDIWNSISMLLQQFGLEGDSARKAAESAVQELRDSTWTIRLETMDSGNAGDLQIPDGNGKYMQLFSWRTEGNEMQLLLCVPQVSMFDCRYYLYITEAMSEDLSKATCRMTLLCDNESAGYDVVKNKPEALTADMLCNVSMTAESIISDIRIQIGTDEEHSVETVTTVTLSELGLNADTEVLAGKNSTHIASAHSAIEIVEKKDLQKNAEDLESISLLDLGTEENQQKLQESLQTGMMNILMNLVQELPEEVTQMLFDEQN